MSFYLLSSETWQIFNRFKLKLVQRDVRGLSSRCRSLRTNNQRTSKTENVLENSSPFHTAAIFHWNSRNRETRKYKTLGIEKHESANSNRIRSSQRTLISPSQRQIKIRHSFFTRSEINFAIFIGFYFTHLGHLHATINYLIIRK